MKKVLHIKSNEDHEIKMELTDWKPDSYQLIIATSTNTVGDYWADSKKKLYLDKKELQKVCDYFNEVNDSLTP